MSNNKRAVQQLQAAEKRRLGKLFAMAGITSNFADALPADLAEEKRFTRTLRNTAVRIQSIAMKRLEKLAGGREPAGKIICREYEKFCAEVNRKAAKD